MYAVVRLLYENVYGLFEPMNTANDSIVETTQQIKAAASTRHHLLLMMMMMVIYIDVVVSHPSITIDYDRLLSFTSDRSHP